MCPPISYSGAMRRHDYRVYQFSNKRFERKPPCSSYATERWVLPRCFCYAYQRLYSPFFFFLLLSCFWTRHQFIFQLLNESCQWRILFFSYFQFVNVIDYRNNIPLFKFSIILSEPLNSFSKILEVVPYSKNWNFCVVSNNFCDFLFFK